MKLSRILILAVAALAGTAVYEVRTNFTVPGTGELPGGEATPESQPGFYAAATGPGSLVSTMRKQTAIRNARLKNRTSPANDYGRSDTPSGPPDDLALLNAAAKGDDAAVQKRLQAGAKVDSRDNERRTALMYAAWNGYPEICSRLLAAGANPEFHDRDEHSMFDYAAGRGQVDEVQYLLERTALKDTQHYVEYAKLVQAAFAGRPELMPPGKGALASVNRINPEGQAPLHIAAGNGVLAMITALIDRGANVNLPNDNKQTPLHWAAWNNQAEAVQALISHGAKVDVPDLGGNTPLIFAAQNGSAQAITVLMKSGADRYIANKDGKTAGLVAQDHGFRDLAAALK